MSKIRHFYSNDSEWVRIKGRGFEKGFSADQIPEGMWDPGDLKGTYCRIDHDGKVYKIIGVEMFRPLISPERPYNKPFGLMVKDPLIPLTVKKTIPKYSSIEKLIEEFQEFLNTVSNDSKLESPRVFYEDGPFGQLQLVGERWLTKDELENYQNGLFNE